MFKRRIDYFYSMDRHHSFNIMSVVFALLLTTTFSVGATIVSSSWNNLGVINDHGRAEVIGVLLVLALISIVSLLFYGFVLSLIIDTRASFISSFLTIIIGCFLFVYASTAPPLLYMVIPAVILIIGLKALHVSFLSMKYMDNSNNHNKNVSGYFRRMAISLGLVFLVTILFSTYMDFYKGQNIVDYFSNDSAVIAMQKILESQKENISPESFASLSKELSLLSKKDTAGQISVFLLLFGIAFLIYLFMRRLYSSNLSQSELITILEQVNYRTKKTSDANAENN